jgi:hypothetical protein
VNEKEIDTICTERLNGWKKDLIADHATPIVLVGVGHDNKSGQIVVCTVKEMQDGEIIILLNSALDQLKKRLHRN